MRAVQRFIVRASRDPPLKSLNFFSFSKPYSTENSDGTNSETDWGATFGSGSADSDKFGWEAGSSSWSTGLTAEHFDGETVGKPISQRPAQDSARREYRVGVGHNDGAGFGQAQWTDEELVNIRALNEANRKAKAFEDGWEGRMRETSALMKQVREPGARGSYLKDSEKAEMYRKHKENPEEYTVERLAKEYRIMRQRVHAILWLKEEEEEQRKLGRELDDSVELLLDSFPEFFNSHDREFHVASLPYKPKFKVMPEGWDGTTRDLDEVHYEISKKEDEMLYQEFVQKLEFNKKKFKKQVAVHKYSRRRPSEGWNFTVEKLGPRGKRGDGGGWKFVSNADGSSRPLNEFEKMFVKRETPRRRKKILP